MQLAEFRFVSFELWMNHWDLFRRAWTCMSDKHLRWSLDALTLALSLCSTRSTDRRGFAKGKNEQTCASFIAASLLQGYTRTHMHACKRTRACIYVSHTHTHERVQASCMNAHMKGHHRDARAHTHTHTLTCKHAFVLQTLSEGLPAL